LNQLLFERFDDLQDLDCGVRSTAAVARLAFIRDSLGRDHGNVQFSRGFRNMNTPSGVRRDNNVSSLQPRRLEAAAAPCRGPADQVGCGQRASLRQIEFVMVLNVSGQSAAPLGPAWTSYRQARDSAEVASRGGRAYWSWRSTGCLDEWKSADSPRTSGAHPADGG